VTPPTPAPSTIGAVPSSPSCVGLGVAGFPSIILTRRAVGSASRRRRSHRSRRLLDRSNSFVDRRRRHLVQRRQRLHDGHDLPAPTSPAEVTPKAWKGPTLRCAPPASSRSPASRSPSPAPPPDGNATVIAATTQATRHHRRRRHRRRATTDAATDSPGRHHQRRHVDATTDAAPRTPAATPPPASTPPRSSASSSPASARCRSSPAARRASAATCASARRAPARACAAPTSSARPIAERSMPGAGRQAVARLPQRASTAATAPPSTPSTASATAPGTTASAASFANTRPSSSHARPPTRTRRSSTTSPTRTASPTTAPTPRWARSTTTTCSPAPTSRASSTAPRPPASTGRARAATAPPRAGPAWATPGPAAAPAAPAARHGRRQRRPLDVNALDEAGCAPGVSLIEMGPPILSIPPSAPAAATAASTASRSPLEETTDAPPPCLRAHCSSPPRSAAPQRPAATSRHQRAPPVEGTCQVADGDGPRLPRPPRLRRGLPGARLRADRRYLPGARSVKVVQDTPTPTPSTSRTARPLPDPLRLRLDAPLGRRPADGAGALRLQHHGVLLAPTAASTSARSPTTSRPEGVGARARALRHRLGRDDRHALQRGPEGRLLPRHPGVFHPTSEAVAVEAGKLPKDIKVMSTDDLYAEIDYQPLSLGVGMGRLRFLTAAELETDLRQLPGDPRPRSGPQRHLRGPGPHHPGVPDPPLARQRPLAQPPHPQHGPARRHQRRHPARPGGQARRAQGRVLRLDRPRGHPGRGRGLLGGEAPRPRHPPRQEPRCPPSSSTSSR
jgi:hypothetical protein